MLKARPTTILSLIIFLIFFVEAYAQDEFPTEEFKARREKLFKKIGDNVGIVSGT